MASKQSRTPSSSSSTTHPKFKFLHKQSRDRSKSLTDPASSSSSYDSTLTTPRRSPHPTSPTALDVDSEFDADVVDEPPIIVEPADIPHPQRTRPFSTVADIQPLSPLQPSSSLQPPSSLYSSTSSSRLSDLPTRLSGWLSHTFSTSSTDLSLPSILTQSHIASAASPKGKGSALLTAAKHGKGHLDRAMRFLMDSDSTPDKCTDPVWLLGVQHPGYEPPPIPPPAAVGRRSSVESRRSNSFRASSSSAYTPSSDLSQSQPPSSKHPGVHWPPVFYADFTSRIWLTYRSQFMPIRDSTLTALEAEASSNIYIGIPASPQPKRWNWPISSEKGWTSDAGWGCMLRTGQSLLANALLHLHLGREWRRPPYPMNTPEYAMYVQILTWFFDTPAPQAPFSVHRMALAGKELGKDVGQWFGPSTAAGAIKTLVHAFPEAGLGVSVASDGVVFQSDVFAASHGRIDSPRRRELSWGHRSVLVLIGIRLGIDGVNPIYYDTIKALFTFPQSVGIAGGRPSSSYYFMGTQADSLFYLDPHHARPAVPLRPPPSSDSGGDPVISNTSTPQEQDAEREHNRRSRPSLSPGTHHIRSPASPVSISPSSSTSSSPTSTPVHISLSQLPASASPTPSSTRTGSSSVRTGSSTFSYHAPASPSPLQHQLSHSTNDSAMSSLQLPVSSLSHGHSRSRPSSDAERDLDLHDLSPRGSSPSDGGLELNPIARHYVTAYTAAELRTFHCERVRKMPLSGLDPSMLLGFLCRDEEDWRDWKLRVEKVMHKYKTIFTIQDEPPTWPSDSDEFMGLESISEPDDMELDADADADLDTEGNVEIKEDIENADEGDDQFFDTQSPPRSVEGSIKEEDAETNSKDSDVDTEDDPVDPITPGTHPSIEIERTASERDTSKGKARESEYVRRAEDEAVGDDDDEEWADPTMPTPIPPPTAVEQKHAHSAPPMAQTKSNGTTSSSESKGKGKKSKKKRSVGVPVVKTPIPAALTDPSATEHYPFPRSLEDTTHERDRDRAVLDSRGNLEKRMNHARARDGGRTQSGGVKGVLAADIHVMDR